MLVSIGNLGVVGPSIIAEEEKRDVMECAKGRWRRGGWRVSSRRKDDVVLFEGRISDTRRIG